MPFEYYDLNDRTVTSSAASDKVELPQEVNVTGSTVSSPD